MNKRKICVVITARPSYARVKTALYEIENHPNLSLQIVVSGSALSERYGNVSQVIEKDGFKISEKVFNLLEGEAVTSMAKTTAIGIMELSTAFANLNPDIVITIADRFETIAASIAASYQNIPLAHIQGGEVTGSIDEKVRHANTKLADYHFVSSEDAKMRVLRMGENENYVFNTGCPSMDIAHDVSKMSGLSFDPIKKYGGVGSYMDWKKGYLVVMQHSVTTESRSAKEQIIQTLEAIKHLNLPTFWFWPNIDSGGDAISNTIRSYRENEALNNIHFFKNMYPADFLSLAKNSLCLIGNSSVGIRECAFLGIPVVNIGSRQSGRQRAENVIDCNYNTHEIEKAIKEQISLGHYQSSCIYGDGTSGEKIAHILATTPLIFDKKISY